MSGAAATPPWKDWVRQAWAVALYETKRNRVTRNAIGRPLLLAVPVVFVLTVALFYVMSGGAVFSESSGRSPPLHATNIPSTSAAHTLALLIGVSW